MLSLLFLFAVAAGSWRPRRGAPACRPMVLFISRSSFFFFTSYLSFCISFRILGSFVCIYIYIYVSLYFSLCFGSPPKDVNTHIGHVYESQRTCWKSEESQGKSTASKTPGEKYKHVMCRICIYIYTCMCIHICIYL